MAVWCPDWPIVAHGRPPGEPAAVFHANRVVASSSAARQAGVERGLRRRESQRRCPALEVLDRDLGLEARTFEPVVAALEDLTPRTEIVRPGLVIFPSRGPARYFGGDLAMAGRCVEVVASVLDGAVVRVGVADGAFGATLAARRAGPEAQAGAEAVQVIPPGGTATFLAPFPVRVLDRPELTSVLVRLGLDDLGRFAALHRSDVVARFGAEGLVAHRLASGLDERPPSMSDPPQDMEVVAELDPPVERVDQAAFTGKALADELLARLDARGATCAGVVVSAQTEHGEELVRCWRHEGPLTAAAVADRVRWQLDGWLNGSSASRPSSGLTRLSVRPDAVIAAAGRQLGFWGGQSEAAARAVRVVARIQGLLGPGSVLAPERRGGRSPEEQVVLVPADTIDLDRDHVDAAESSGPWPGSVPGPVPMWRHPSQRKVEVLDVDGRLVTVDGRAQLSAEPDRLVFDGRHEELVDRWAGPWPLDERWWDVERRRRRARVQVVDVSGNAWWLTIEGGQWWLDATYD